jgi:hypothetical protein
VLTLLLLVEIAVPLAYCALMSLIILVGPGGLTPPWFAAIGIHVIVAVWSLISFFGVGFRFFGLLRRNLLVKSLLITLSMLCMVISLAIYVGTQNTQIVAHLPVYVAGWCVILWITARAAFHCVDRRKPMLNTLA